MRRNRSRWSTRGTLVGSRCVWCGSVEFALDDLVVHAGRDEQGLVEFSCPSCGRLNVRGIDADDLSALEAVGAGAAGGPAPFELLERHDGPPITWDDLIDFHEAVSRLDGRTWWPRSDPGSADPVQERDAA